jgi:hypothetical protein
MIVAADARSAHSRAIDFAKTAVLKWRHHARVPFGAAMESASLDFLRGPGSGLLR